MQRQGQVTRWFDETFSLSRLILETNVGVLSLCFFPSSLAGYPILL